MTELSSPLGLIAGNGTFPIEFAENARARGLSLIAVAIRGEADPRLEALSERCTWVRLGQLGKMISTLKKSGVKQAAFVGGVTRVNFVDGFKIDWRGLSMLARLRSFNDDAMLRGIMRELERDGIEVIASSLLLEKSVAHKGILTRRALTVEELENARLGWQAARAIGSMDIGQAVVVRNKTIIAVEAVEGTDATLQRAGNVRGKDGVLVKLAKEIQDLRIDLPTIGMKTIERMQECRISAVVLEAEKSLILEPQEVLRRADGCGISIFAAEKIEDLS